MIRIETKAGHGAGKPTAKVVSYLFCIEIKKFIVLMIDLHMVI